ncbi:OmpA family protein [Solimonas soli]|uniref:OmpA family protein n=1 Tax=Solimonas soli TaxID=413479 RepID=UPI0004BA05C1|nr:OmpA family protein [Solimonas soli]
MKTVFQVSLCMAAAAGFALPAVAQAQYDDAAAGQPQADAVAATGDAGAAAAADAFPVMATPPADTPVTPAEAAPVPDDATISTIPLAAPPAEENAKPILSPLLDGGYVSVMGTYLKSLQDPVLSNNFGGSLLLGYRDEEHNYALETGLTYTTSSGVQRQSFKIKALLFPFDSLPYLYGVIGGGMTRFVDYPHSHIAPILEATPNDDFFTVDVMAGLGYMLPLHVGRYDFAIRAEALYQLGDRFLERESDFKEDIDAPSTFKDVMVNIGLQLPLKLNAPAPAPAAAPAAVVPPVAPVDSDGDGVPDDRDQCPNTPAGTQVNDVGCPLAPPPCKPPEAGQRIDLSGCAVGDSVVLRGVNFEFDKATLTVNAETILDGVADALAAAPSIHVEVAGHTDSKGRDEYNQQLSERRAQAVVHYLEQRGVASDRMSAKGYGESQPIADNDTDEGRELNRRVELRIVSVDAPAGDAAAAPIAPVDTTQQAPADIAPMVPAEAERAPPAEPAPESPITE